MSDIEDLIGLICALIFFTFIAIFFPEFNTTVSAANSSNVMYPLVQQFPLILLIASALVAIYFAYEVLGD